MVSNYVDETGYESRQTSKLKTTVLKFNGEQGDATGVWSTVLDNPRSLCWKLSDHAQSLAFCSQIVTE